MTKSIMFDILSPITKHFYVDFPDHNQVLISKIQYTCKHKKLLFHLVTTGAAQPQTQGKLNMEKKQRFIGSIYSCDLKLQMILEGFMENFGGNALFLYISSAADPGFL